MFLIRLKPSQFPGDAPGVSFFHYLRRALPPYITYIVYVELDAGSEYINYSDDDSMEEAEGFFDTPEPVVENVLASFVEESVIVKLIKEC